MAFRVQIAFGALLLASGALAQDVAVVPNHLSVGDMYRGVKGQAKKECLCGMHVSAISDQADGSALVWDIAWSVFTDGTTRQAGVSAGSFTVAAHAKARSPRMAITALAFSIAGAAPTAAQLVGANADNGVVGGLPEAYAEELFDALDLGRPIAVDISFGANEHELVHLKTHGGSQAELWHGRNTPMRNCLRVLVPKTGEPRPIIEIPHPDS